MPLRGRWKFNSDSKLCKRGGSVRVNAHAWHAAGPSIPGIFPNVCIASKRKEVQNHNNICVRERGRFISPCLEWTMTKKSGEIRLRYLYRGLILSGKAKLSLEAARGLIGPDCAYHLYGFVERKGAKRGRARAISRSQLR
jgi:hypothetical protein